MNEPKKRGRPSNAELAARNAQVEGGDVRMIAAIPTELHAVVTPEVAVFVATSFAQAYANKVWAGQSQSLTRHERLGRVADALKAQGLSMEGVELP